MSFSHLENMPSNHSNPQGAQRSSWKLCLVCSTVTFILLCLFIILIFVFLPLKIAKEPCIAKFGPLPSEWQTTSSEPLCVEVDDISVWKLKILRSGLYVIYSQVAPNTTYKELAPFEVQLRKNNVTIQTVTDNSKTQNVGGTYELHAGDTIGLRFNHEYQVLKNNTYWGILLLANPQFIF
ncbi:tumor necrosis factor ligand superfamily member 18 [Orycteropus afer afer]|uniref:Tumor necrosis factor ligand superfamily member 18 n=1 Tax=Orycteropus afer afer TaxID=1230840 RepID=A0A8B7ABH0_ORYAF|nr:tumor necrosis factor ligand superfamily member 18 [Orycteropus afer afer]